MQSTITTFDLDGKIIKVISCPESMVGIQRLPEGGGYVPGQFDGRTHYVLKETGNQIVARPAIKSSGPDKNTIISDGEDTATINGLPLPCTVIVQNQRYHVDDGSFEFTTDTPGQYEFTVEAWPYLDATFTLEAL